MDASVTRSPGMIVTPLSPPLACGAFNLTTHRCTISPARVAFVPQSLGNLIQAFG